MTKALRGEEEFRDRFYFITRRASHCFKSLRGDLAGKRVVVVGCSDGGVTPLARMGVYVEGIDISAVSIDKLNRSIDKEGLRQYANARVMDAENLDYGEKSLDAIACTGVLHHLDTEVALRSWARCLNDEGFVLMFEPLALHPLVAVFRAFTPSMHTPDEHPLTEKDFALMSSYFERIERYNFALFTPISAAIAVVPGLAWLARLLLPSLEAADVLTLRLLPFLGRFCWLTVVKLGGPRLRPNTAAMVSS